MVSSALNLRFHPEQSRKLAHLLRLLLIFLGAQDSTSLPESRLRVPYIP